MLRGCPVVPIGATSSTGAGSSTGAPPAADAAAAAADRAPKTERARLADGEDERVERPKSR